MLQIIFIPKMGGTEVILIVAVILIFFGGKKIPQLMKGLGQGIREFKDAKDGNKSDEELPEKKD